MDSQVNTFFFSNDNKRHLFSGQELLKQIRLAAMSIGQQLRFDYILLESGLP